MPLSEALQARIHSSQRLVNADLMELFTSTDVMGLGYLAELVNYRQNHGEVTYREHRFLRVAGTENELASIKQQARDLVTDQTGEIRLVSISPNRLSLPALHQLLTALKGQHPHCDIRGLSAFQVLQYLALNPHLGLRDLLRGLFAAGLSHIEGRPLKANQMNAKITGRLPQDLRELLAEPYELWRCIHGTGHEVGLRSEAILDYATHEPIEMRIAQLNAIRDLQDKTNGFDSYVALNKKLVENHFEAHPLLTLDDLRTIAISRLYLDNLTCIRAPWGRLGINIAQLALSFGANELEGSLSHENNSQIAGARPFRSMNREEVRSVIAKAHFKPVERVTSAASIRQQPIGQQPSSPAAISALYKISRQASLTASERLTLCREASLLGLGTCALEAKARLMTTTQVGLLGDRLSIRAANKDSWVDIGQRLATGAAGKPRAARGEPLTVLLDLADAPASCDLTTIAAIVADIRKSVANFEVVILGIKGLWLLSRNHNITLIKLSQELKNLGVVAVESSSYEAEDDLTLSEITNTHSILHQMDLATIGKLELAAPYHGRGEPFWESFLDRIDMFNRIQQETHGLLGIKVEAAEGANISPAEYLRAVAISRIFMPDIPNIITPIDQLPLINLTKNDARTEHIRISKKLAPLATFFGSNDLVFLPQAAKLPTEFREELEAMGIQAFNRSGRFHPY